MHEILEFVNGIVWGAPALVLILGVGLYLSVRTGLAQIVFFPSALRSFWAKLTGREKNADGVSPFQALCTALAATVGTGNLVGVAGAIAIGGPGSIFWMWVCAFFGMVTKYAEATLAVRYRHRKDDGEWVGGPMHMICRGMGERWRWLAGLYSFFGVTAAFGVGNATQVNAVVSSVNSTIEAFGGRQSRCGDIIMGFCLAMLVLAMLLGGAKRIGTVAERLIPLVSALYLLLCLFVLTVRAQEVPTAFSLIIRGAFEPSAVTGGVVGTAIVSLRVGASRGVFSNEAGMGTASIAHASAQVCHPSEQGLMGIMEVFLDTVVICTMTALVILTSGAELSYGQDVGAVLTINAFCAVCGQWVTVFLALALCCFALGTVLGWGLYGIRCAQFLFGQKAWRPFVYIQAAVVLISVLLDTSTVWAISELVNGLMAIPNLIALFCLTPELVRLTAEYRKMAVDISVSCGKMKEKQRQCGKEEAAFHPSERGAV